MLLGFIHGYSAYFSFKVLPELDGAGYYSDRVVASRTFIRENVLFTMMAVFGSRVNLSLSSSRTLLCDHSSPSLDLAMMPEQRKMGDPNRTRSITALKPRWSSVSICGSNTSRVSMLTCPSHVSVC
jgi:hypothetical protein